MQAPAELSNKSKELTKWLEIETGLPFAVLATHKEFYPYLRDLKLQFQP